MVYRSSGGYGCGLETIGGLLAMIGSFVLYLIVMITSGWHTGVVVGGAVSLVGLAFLAISAPFTSDDPVFAIELYGLLAAVPTFFVRWGNGASASSARHTAYWVAGIAVACMALTFIKRALDKCGD